MAETHSALDVHPVAALPRLFRSRAAVAAAVVLLLLLHGYLAISAAAKHSITFDEPAHLAGGYAVLSQSDFRLSDNAGLADLWMALPLYWSAAEFPDLDQPGWQRPDAYVIGDQLLYGISNDADHLAAQGRAMIVLLSMALGLVIWLWARHLLGRGGAFVALLLYVFDPGMLAHGSLMTADLAATLFLLLATGCVWLCLQRLTPARLAGSILAAAALLLCKASGVLIVPIALILGIIRIAGGRPWPIRLGRHWDVHRRGPQAGVLLAVVVAHLLAGYVLVWAWYGFRYQAFRAADPQRDGYVVSWEETLQQRGAISSAIAKLRDHRILPEGFLRSYAVYADVTQTRLAFLNGKVSAAGFPGFFPYCLLVKTPLALMGLLLVGLCALLLLRKNSPWSEPLGPPLSPRELFYQLSPLLVLLFVYGVVALTSHINIGHRHVLPLYPPLIILAGAAGLFLQKRTWPLALAVVALTGLLVVESTLIRPHYLSYFNAIAGGPRQGYRHLVDSSLDWGQELPALRDFLDENELLEQEHTPVYLSYFGTADPAYHGIDAQLLPGWVRGPRGEAPSPLQGGIYCISATIVQGIFPGAPGPWCRPYEEHYQQLLAQVKALHQAADDQSQLELLVSAKPPAQWRELFRQFEALRLARLCAFLREGGPNAQVGYGLLIYHLTQPEVDSAQFGPPAELMDDITLEP